MVHRKTFHERCSFPKKVVVVPNLRSQESGFQSAGVPQSLRATEFANDDVVYSDDFLDRGKVMHQDLPSSSPRRRFFSRLA